MCATMLELMIMIWVWFSLSLKLCADRLLLLLLLPYEHINIVVSLHFSSCFPSWNVLTCERTGVWCTVLHLGERQVIWIEQYIDFDGNGLLIDYKKWVFLKDHFTGSGNAAELRERTQWMKMLGHVGLLGFSSKFTRKKPFAFVLFVVFVVI